MKYIILRYQPIPKLNYDIYQQIRWELTQTFELDFFIYIV